MKRTRSRIKLALAASTVALTSVLASVPAPATGSDAARVPQPGPAADYRFGNTLQSSSGTAPGLKGIGPRLNTFGTEVVNGKPRSVYQFPRSNGVQLNSVSTVIPRDEYTIVLLMRFDQVSSYRRIINFDKSVEDTGLYVYFGELHLYDSAEGNDSVIAADEWVQVVLTRTAGGRVKGYVDGALQFTVNDSTDEYAAISEADVLRFFRDDSNREEAAGSVARIRLYDRPMSEARVAALRELPPAPNVTADPFSAAPGAAITVEVANFGPFETVGIWLRDATHGWRKVGKGSVDRSGGGSIEVNVRNDTTVGPGRILAKGATSGLRRARPFTFDAPEDL